VTATFLPGDVVTMVPNGVEVVSLLVEATETTPMGTHPIEVTGTGSGSHVVTVDLKVTPRPPGRRAIKLGVGVPVDFELSQNYPNPFNPETTIEFGLPEDGHVNVQVYNMLGQVVGDLVDEQLDAGYYSVSWHAAGLPTGIYFYRIEAEGYTATKRMVYMK
jgi:hypothetical protein